MTPESLRDLAVEALEDGKGQDILALDVSEASSVTDWMIIATGTSNRHVKSLVDGLVERAKAAGQRPLGIEGADGSEWVLVDLGDAVVHVMRAETRQLYDLERLWKMPHTRGNSMGSPGA